MEWMLMPLKRYAEFTGRSRRMEFWMFTLFTTIVSIVLLFISGLGGALTNPEALAVMESGEGAFAGMGVGIILIGIFGLAVLIPSIAVAVRRLHDRDMSGW